MSNELPLPLVPQAVAQRLVSQIAALHTSANPHEKIIYASLVSTLIKRNDLIQFGFHLSEHAFAKARRYAREYGPGVPHSKPVQPQSKQSPSSAQLDSLKEFLLVHSSPAANRTVLIESMATPVHNLDATISGLFRAWKVIHPTLFSC